MRFLWCVFALSALDTHSNSHSTADAERGKPLLGVPFLHLVEQRGQYARAGGADRMADGDGAAIDVDLGRIPAEVLIDRASLRRESFIRFDQVEVLFLPAGLLERGARRRDRTGAHDRRIDAGLCP